jgi:hypothetical protein
VFDPRPCLAGDGEAVLNDSADALARLAPANLATIDDLVYQSK